MQQIYIHIYLRTFVAYVHLQLFYKQMFRTSAEPRTRLMFMVYSLAHFDVFAVFAVLPLVSVA